MEPHMFGFSFEGEFVDAVGSDLNDVHGFTVPRHGDIVRAAKTLIKKKKKKKRIEKILTNLWRPSA